jgi:hypothetical protein
MPTLVVGMRIRKTAKHAHDKRGHGAGHRATNVDTRSVCGRIAGEIASRNIGSS